MSVNLSEGGGQVWNTYGTTWGFSESWEVFLYVWNVFFRRLVELWYVRILGVFCAFKKISNWVLIYFMISEFLYFTFALMLFPQNSP